jgi:hypothetical protein
MNSTAKPFCRGNAVHLLWNFPEFYKTIRSMWSQCHTTGPYTKPYHHTSSYTPTYFLVFPVASLPLVFPLHSSPRQSGLRSLQFCSFSTHHFIPLWSKYSPQHLFLTLRLWSSLSVSDQLSHPYRTTSKFVVLHILIFFIADEKTKGSGQNGSKHYHNSISP